MGFTWSNSASQGTKINIEQITEVKNNLDSLKASVLDVSPAVSETSTVNIDAAIANGKITDDVFDEIQNYLDNLRENNYCRSYHATRYDSKHDAKNTSVFTTLCSTNHSTNQATHA
jgi:hypothetical protein